MRLRKAVWVLIPLLMIGTSLFAGDTSRYDDVFRKYSKRFFGVGFDWRVFKAQGLAESALNPEARSWVGAIGIMQLMPSTFKEVQSANPDFTDVNDPDWNIAGGIYYDRQLWKAWTKTESAPDRLGFVFGSYNAGRGTIMKAQGEAAKAQLDDKLWPSIEEVAPQVPKWRHEETLGYVKRIENFYATLSGTKGFDDFLGK
ncbi:MAG TPA: transglycosylase SLT domain-containing protein [Acidobacteriota bacterium]|nr:transglycosylase SLT domain-containing protein [Acidobacteriota bacterium]